jgi:hypothetical protein
MGAPGLAFETWDPSNQFPLETPLSPLSSRGIRGFPFLATNSYRKRRTPPLSSRPERTQISYLVAIPTATYAAFPLRKAHEACQRHQVPQEIWGSVAEGPAVSLQVATKPNCQIFNGNTGERSEPVPACRRNNYFRGSTISKFFWCINDTTTLAVCSESHCSLVIGKLKMANPCTDCPGVNVVSRGIEAALR